MDWMKTMHPGEMEIDELDMMGNGWREKDFSGYDAVFHVAGIAHADVGNVSEETKQLYYKVNRDLTLETAQKAKKENVPQFIFMSSMIIYGESGKLGQRKVITDKTVPSPENFYGDSKWQADQGVRQMEGDAFHVAVLRPPMIYGPNSKGNYPLLAKLAKKLPLFPDIQNERSMLYIGNLCAFLRLLILSGENGIYFPQNRGYVRTSNMVKGIAGVSGHRIMVTSLLNPLVGVGETIPGKISGLINKAFGNMVYEKSISNHFDGSYQIYSLKDSIQKTEGNGKDA